jgi:hypothetical protein
MGREELDRGSADVHRSVALLASFDMTQSTP